MPEERSLKALARAAQSCRGCDLYKNATQTVFGEGPARARVILVGEQPGDREDIEGHPFVGPAGRMLDKALAAAEIERRDVYITNIVKHFKWKLTVGEAEARRAVLATDRPRKRRLHDKPRAGEVRACRPWFDAEVSAVHPQVIVCLGVTAAKAIVGSQATITRDRGRIIDRKDGPPALITVHPSAILRMPEKEDRDRGFADLVKDLRIVRRYLK